MPSGMSKDLPCFAIGVAARMVGMHAQTLRSYERIGLVRPGRRKGRARLYSQADIERLRHIRHLIDDLGLNLAGVDVMLRMAGRMAEMEQEMERMRRQLQAAGLLEAIEGKVMNR